MKRTEFAYRGINGNEHILEFGPSYNPMYPKTDGYKTEIVDYCDENELRRNGYTASFNADRIEKVDYVCKGDYYNYISGHGGGNYDIIAASHFIEHTVDFVRFLQDISKLLKDSGIIKLVIPDKRFEFDCFREKTSLRVVIDTYYCNFSNHSIGAIIESDLMTKNCVDNNAFYLNSMSLYDDASFSCNYSNSIGDAIDYMNKSDNSTFRDIHSWTFTPSSFECLITQLNVLGLIDLVVQNLYSQNNHEMNNCCQFFAELTKGKVKNPCETMRALYIRVKREDYDEFYYASEILRQKERGSKIYIFGTGDGATQLSKLLDRMGVEYLGYLVSDGHKKWNSFLNKDVIEISELDTGVKDDICVLLGVFDEEYRNEIKGNLSKRKIRWAL